MACKLTGQFRQINKTAKLETLLTPTERQLNSSLVSQLTEQKLKPYSKFHKEKPDCNDPTKVDVKTALMSLENERPRRGTCRKCQTWH